MTIAIMQPYILPYIGYLQLMANVDKFIFYDDVAFINRGWINRNRVLMNGKDFMFTIPLKEASQNKLINEIHIDNAVNWRPKFLKSIEQSYKKAPFYPEIYPMIEKIVNNNSEKINDYIIDSFELLNVYLGIKTTIIRSSSSYQNTHLKAQERILDICKQEKANHYVNPIGGMELYQKERFEREKIKLSFIKTKSIQYTQFKNEFIPWLSILDVLMFNDSDKIQGFLNEFELV